MIATVVVRIKQSDSQATYTHSASTLLNICKILKDAI